MSLKNALFFIDKIYQYSSFQESYNRAECLSGKEVCAFAARENIEFTAEELELAYERNYKMRWMLKMGKKTI